MRVSNCAVVLSVVSGSVIILPARVCCLFKNICFLILNTTKCNIKMALPSLLCGINLRLKCFIIAYLHLFASIVDIGCHVIITGILSNGFQCVITRESLAVIDLPWLELLLLIVNFGTHGFYPFPLDLHSYYYHIHFIIAPTQQQCFPGMLHIYLIDIINFFINVIWLKFVIAFVTAVHKKEPEPMRMFFGLSLVKLVLQMMFFLYQFNIGYASPSYSFLNVIDFSIAAVFLMLINAYILQLRLEMSQKKADQPPSYIECLINTPQTRADEKRDAVLIIEEKKAELPVESETMERR